ncbi:MAG: hypothetical protein ACI9BD_000100 [Candidatus Marinamargulisbacteria bacterium]|jgi:hypothetical protein
MGNSGFFRRVVAVSVQDASLVREAGIQRNNLAIPKGMSLYEYAHVKLGRKLLVKPIRFKNEKSTPAFSSVCWGTHTFSIHSLDVRPAAVRSAIERRFEAAQEESGAYLFTGSPTYRFGMNGLRTDSALMIDAALKRSSEGSVLRILDVGAADAQFQMSAKKTYGDQVSVVGLTARKYPGANDLNDSEYRVQNAEHLLDSETLTSYSQDMIFSSVTVRHFADPAGFLVQAYEALDVGGVLVVDQFSLRGLEGQYGAIHDYLRKQGFRVSASFTSFKFNHFIIQKNRPHLAFPFTYQKQCSEDHHARYRLTEDLPAPKKIQLHLRFLSAKELTAFHRFNVQNLVLEKSSGVDASFSLNGLKKDERAKVRSALQFEDRLNAYGLKDRRTRLLRFGVPTEPLYSSYYSESKGSGEFEAT